MIYFTPNELLGATIAFFVTGVLGFIGYRTLAYAIKGTALLVLLPSFIMLLKREHSSALGKIIGNSIKNGGATPTGLKDVFKAIAIICIGIVVTVLNYALLDGIARIYSLLMLALGFFTAIKLIGKPIDVTLNRMLFGILFILTHTLNLLSFPVFILANMFFKKIDKRNG